MKINLRDFSPPQLDFLSALAIMKEPISLNLMNTLVPLSPASLVSLIKKAEQFDLLRHSETMIELAPDIPEELSLSLRDKGTPEFAAVLIARLKKQERHVMSNPSLLANLSARAGQKFEAASLENDMAGEFIKNSDANRAIPHLQKAVSYLIDSLGQPESDSLFISVVLDLSHTYHLIGEGYEEIPQLLDLAHTAAERLGDKRSQALVSLHVGRFFFLSDRLTRALDILSEGLQKVKQLGDDDILSQSAEFEGLYYYLQGRYREAAEFFAKAIHAVPEGETEFFNIFLPSNLAYSYALLGQFHHAIGVLDSNLRRAQICLKPSLAVLFRSSLGTVLLMMGKMEEALTQLKKAKQEAISQGNKNALFFTTRSMAFYLYLKNRIRDSYNLMSETIQSTIVEKTIIYRQNTWPWLLDMLYTYHQMGFAPINGLDFEQEMEKSLNGPNVLLRGVALRIRAHQAMLRGDEITTVRRILKDSKNYTQLSGNPIERSNTLVEIARLELPSGKPEKILHYVLDAMELTAGYEHEFVPAEMKALVTSETDDRISPNTTFDRFLEMMHEFLPSPENEELYSRVIRATCRFFGAERGGLFWFTPDRKGARPALRASYNLTNIEVNAEEFRSNMGLVFKTYQNNQPLIIRPDKAKSRADQDKRSFILCLPLEIRGTVQGVLYHENSYLEGFLPSMERAQLVKIMHYTNRYFEKIENYSLMVESRSNPNIKLGSPSSYVQDNEEIKTESQVMLEILARADSLAVTDAPALILGETGVGKELLARRLHTKSRRCSQPFVVVDLPSIPENLVESELFGYEKGAFTGADGRKQGRIEQAHKGTLFLDEIGEIPQSVQVKLLRVLQEKTFTRIGGRNHIDADFRLVAATNRNLAHEVAAGNFREDLYYRLNVVEILVPPLRERGEDIILLANFFLEQFSHKYQKENLALSPKDKDLIAAYHWPGNVRELKNVMERAIILSAGVHLQLTQPIERPGPLEAMFYDLPTMDEMQRQYIHHVLQKTGGRIGGPGGAAEILGMKRTTLNSRMKQLGLK